MAVFSNVSPATTPTRSSGRGANAKKDPLGAFLAFKSSRVSHLKRQSSVGSRYQTTCISKHYALNYQVYEAFRVHYYNLSSMVDTSSKCSNNNHNSQTETAKSNFEWISSAFCLGWNFVESALLDLPTHGYFYSNGDQTYVKLRKQSSLTALEVTRLLQRLLRLVDSMSLKEGSSSGGVSTRFLDSSDATISLTNDPTKDPNARWLLEHNREECKRRLSTLKYLAKEQCEHLDSYEDKRLGVTSKWHRHFSTSMSPRPDPDGSSAYSNSSSSSINVNKVLFSSPPRRGAPKTTTVTVGNHRSYTSKRRDFDRDEPTQPLMVDCETVGESLLSCSRMFCSPPQPESPPSREMGIPHTIATPTRKASPLIMPRPSLADDEEHGCEDDNEAGSEYAVFDSRSKSPPSSVNAGGLLVVKKIKSDDAVFTSPTDNSLIGKAKGLQIFGSNDRQGVSSPDRDTGSRSSNKKRRTPNSKKKVSRYTNRLFGKKTNDVQHHQQKAREEAELQEALYQSQLETAKAESMREEELEAVMAASMRDEELDAAKAASMRETKDMVYQCNGNFSSYDRRDVSAMPPFLSAAADDCDLQHALYLSGLEVKTPHGTVRNPNHQKSSETTDWCNNYDDQEEKRDDSAREGPLSSRRQEDAAPVVVKGMQVIVKGMPVVRTPPGAVHRCRNGTDPFDSFKMIKSCFQKDFERLREQKKVVVTRVATYQGRIQGSTNGCTVIAPLLCAHYFKTKNDDSPQSRLSDDTILSVIDTESPSLLPTIRRSLGVSKNAFLIPHDAHEHLIESKHMSRDQFVTVCGGNILEEGHLGVLIKELSKILPDGKRLGATFFFHQHVIAILQLRDSDSKQDDTAVSFDIVDSLPSKATLPPPPTSPKSDKLRHRTQNCARIFCKDASSLKATLKWYACSVFTAENERYIDDYHWDEKLTDFDPRVFQAFLWKEI